MRISPVVLDRLDHLLEPDLVRAAQETARLEPDGWSIVEIPLETIEYTAGVLLRLCVDAEVPGPPDLRQHMSETTAALASAYAK